MLSNSLIQFSVDGWSCVPYLLFTWDQTMVELVKIMAISFKRFHARTATFSAPNPAACHRRPTPPPETPEHSQASLGQSLVWSLPLSPGSWCAQVSVCAFQESISPVLCKFWQLYGGVNGNLLQEGLCHTQVCCTQPHPFGGKCIDQTGLKSWCFQTFNVEPDKFFKNWVCGMEHDREVPFSLP